ncbi:hypothetical protein AB0H63_23360 [Micromonospora echinospora]|uniref:hypothetical protein n=1 Tax=Micromonospora echinospora TaxID=1877 RepID=UPI0033F80F75
MEFLPTSPEKPDLLALQLVAFAPLGFPMIATGFVFARDGLSLLEHGFHLDQLAAAGVR